MTCADELGAYAAAQITHFLDVTKKNETFEFKRSGIVSPAKLPDPKRSDFITAHPAYGRLFCRCRQVSEGEIREAIRRGARTVDAVKRRTGAGTGRCQGAYCMLRILRLISEETGQPISEIRKEGPGTEIFPESSDVFSEI